MSDLMNEVQRAVSEMKYGPERDAIICKAYEASGLSQSEFARRVCIANQAIHAAYRRYRKRLGTFVPLANRQAAGATTKDHDFEYQKGLGLRCSNCFMSPDWPAGKSGCHSFKIKSERDAEAKREKRAALKAKAA
jgi:hypothetical protein